MAGRNATDAATCIHTATHAAATMAPRDALALLCETAETITRKNEWPLAGTACYTFIEEAVTHRLKDESDTVARALYTHAYNHAAPHVEFSKGFKRRMAAGVKKWAAGDRITEDEWALHTAYGNADPLVYLRIESDAFDAATDPDGSLVNASAPYFHRADPYDVLGFDTLVLPAAPDKETGFAYLKRAGAHVTRQAFYSLETDRILFRRAQFNQNGGTFHASTAHMGDLMDVVGTMRFMGNSHDAVFFAHGLTDAHTALTVLGHEKIHQLHMRRYMVARHEPYKRRAMGMDWFDVGLTTASILAAHEHNPQRERNHAERLANDVLQQTVLMGGGRTAYRL